MIAATAQTTDVSLTLPADPGAAALARRELVQAGLGEDIERTVAMLATELVTNAVRHAGLRSGDRMALRATIEPDFARVELHDGGGGFDPDVRHETSGFGLRLIETLSSQWGTTGPPGFAVWFEVDRRRGQRFARDKQRPATSRSSQLGP